MYIVNVAHRHTYMRHMSYTKKDRERWREREGVRERERARGRDRELSRPIHVRNLPQAWNSLPVEMRNAPMTRSIFKNRLKTFLCEQTYPAIGQRGCSYQNFDSI